MCVYDTYDKLDCIFQYILDRGQNFCPTNRFNLMVTPYYSDTSYYAYGGEAADGGTAAICTAYCVDD